MGIAVTSSVHAALLREAERAHPAECCGLLLGTEALVAEARPTQNVAADPARHFEIGPQALIDAHRAERAGGSRLLGYFHSHPTGDLRPSATDRAMAAGDGRIWAIVANGEVALWRDDAAGFERLGYRVVDG